jgi:DNA-binding transcriptional LysR family regulator
MRYSNNHNLTGLGTPDEVSPHHTTTTNGAGMGIGNIMHDWDGLKVIFALVRAGTIQEAAKQLGMNPTTVSRKVDKLTKEIGHTLLTRKNGLWVPTDLGQKLFELGERINEEVANELLMQQRSQSGARNVVISMERHLQEEFLDTIINSTDLDDESVSVTLVSEPRSLALGEADIRIDHREPIQGRLIRVFLGTSEFGIFEPAEIQASGWIAYDHDEFEPLMRNLRDHFGMPPRLSTDCMQQAMQVAESQGYACVLPTRRTWIADGLVRSPILKNLIDLPVWMSFHETQKHDQVLKSFRTGIVRSSRDAMASEVE